jgi:UDP-N-acetylmuramoylalanine--D-glutamate ligase
MELAGKQIAVLGVGESGRAAAGLLKRHGAFVRVLDSGSGPAVEESAALLRNAGVEVDLGAQALAGGHSYDLAVVSPGIDPGSELFAGFLKRGIPCIGELELAYGFCKCPVVGITGTNGKTTTTQLVERMLNGAGVRTLAAGNIGPAFSARVEQSAALDVMTLEVSSFQLERVEQFRARVAVWLGFAADHLDRYSSLEEYRAAKLRIFERQSAADHAVVNLRSELPPLAAQRITFSAYHSGGDFECRDNAIWFRGNRLLGLEETRLRGLHNVENLMAALGVGVALGVSPASLVAPLREYVPLPHRCEWIRQVDGVDWVNDSKGTNPDSVEKALESENRPVVLIAGGKDKGFEFDALTELVSARCRATVVLGEMAGRIEALWGSRVRCRNAGRSLEQAVAVAREEANPGDVVLFSPGTSSFDMFRNYADRGDQFRRLVHALVPTHSFSAAGSPTSGPVPQAEAAQESR